MTYLSNYRTMNANSPTTISNWLQKAQGQLKNTGIESYRLDNLVLLEYVTKFNRAHILAHQDKELYSHQLLELNKLLERRSKREPIAYITGVKEFYGRDFYVDKNVLIPRPESESFIELLKKHRITHQTAVDVGCGSGVLGITAKLELPTLDVTLIDINEKALGVAKKNAKDLGIDCSFKPSDLLPLDSDYFVILANLPYVPKDMRLQPELTYEPSVALFADNKGLGLYERLWSQISQQTSCTYVLTESLWGQHTPMIQLAKSSGFSLIETDGLVQLFKRS